MKKKFFKILSLLKVGLPYLMLVVLLSSIMITSFHNHNCDEDSDNCTACRLQQNFSSLTFEPTTHDVLLQKKFSDSILILNEQATDPSQKNVCSSHAPPQFS
jgi:hypothetical protein